MPSLFSAVPPLGGRGPGGLLIVHDEPEILGQLADDLAAESFSLLKAHSHAEALEVLDCHPVSVLLCDQQMARGLQGTDLLREAQNKQPHLVGMILSAFGEPEYLLSAVNDAKIFCYMLKPWTAQELVDNVGQALELAAVRWQLHEKEQELRQQMQHLLSGALFGPSPQSTGLQEASQALAAISDRAGQLAKGLDEQLRKIFFLPDC